MTPEQQLQLSGFGPIPEPTDRLFFAVFPDHTAANQIARLAVELRAECRLIGQPLKVERFHTTLHYLGDHAGLPSTLVDSAMQAAAAIDMPAFEVAFDRAGSFKRGAANRPVVLLGGEGLSALIEFQQALGASMATAGLSRWVTKDYNPHVTLLYDRRGISEQPMEPVTWKVNEFVLVQSHLGETANVVLGRWPLRG